FVKKHTLRSGYTLLGIQTAAYGADHWWFGCYGNKLLKCDAELKTVEGFDFGGSLGLVALPDGRFLIGRDTKDGDRHIGRALEARPHANAGMRLAPRP